MKVKDLLYTLSTLSPDMDVTIGFVKSAHLSAVAEVTLERGHPYDESTEGYDDTKRTDVAVIWMDYTAPYERA